MITCKEDLYGTHVLISDKEAIDLYIDLINDFGLGKISLETREKENAIEVHEADWTDCGFCASFTNATDAGLDYGSKRLTISDLNKPKAYTQAEADQYAKKCVDHDRKRFAHEKCVQCGYSLKQAEALEQQMNDKQETVLATEMSERDIPDFEGMAGVFDACANNEVDFDNAPQHIESLSTTPKPDNNNKEMSDCIDAISSQLGLTFGFDVGYADLPYKLATHIAGLKVDGAVDAVADGWKNGDACIYDGNTAVFIGFRPVRKHLCVVEIYDYEGMSCVVKTVFVDELKKPESPQEKEKRERLEAAYDLCKVAYPEFDASLEAFVSGDKDSISRWLSIVDKTNYRKGE